MLLCILLFSPLPLLISSFNVCSIDNTACVPLEDFDTNCTCMLITGKPVNATDDVFVFFMGYEMPLSLFSQKHIAPIVRAKLDIRIPKSSDYESSLDMPETIYKNLETYENMAFFTANYSMTPIILNRLINESFIRTEELTNSSEKWCAEGECNAFVYSTSLHNRTAGIYAHAADLLHVIEFRGRSTFAVSSVYSKFDIPKVHSTLCESKCRKFLWNEGLLCNQKCLLGLRFDQVAITGDLKRRFENFVKAAAVNNLRLKYHKYLKYNPKMEKYAKKSS